MNTAESDYNFPDTPQFVPCIPSPTRRAVPDNPTEDEAKEVLATLDQMAVIEGTGDIVVRRSRYQCPEERLWLAVHGVGEGWSLLLPFT